MTVTFVSPTTDKQFDIKEYRKLCEATTKRWIKEMSPKMKKMIEKKGNQTSNSQS